MRPLVLAFAALLLAAPLAAGLVATHAPAAAPAPAPRLSTAPAAAPAPPRDLVRVVVNNTDGSGQAMLTVRAGDGSVVYVGNVVLHPGQRAVLDVPANPTTYEVELRLPLASGESRVDPSGCPGDAAQVLFTTQAGLLQESLGVDGGCLAPEG